ncbi:MAG TPA: rod shape-determining protein MreD [Novosphingobium sp.]|nr:rod shape-determining protein MreD [Novosphingobium sp.]
MPQRLPRWRSPSPVAAYVTPWLTIMLASLVTGWPLIGEAPVMPPLGFMTLLSWRHLRPGLLPVWAGVPLGLFDDMVSGQPLGSAILLWSATMIALEIFEARFPWRNFLVDWMVAGVLIAAYLILSLLIANAAGGNTLLLLLAPQAIVSIAIHPLIGRMVGRFDRWRLFRFRVVG